MAFTISRQINAISVNGSEPFYDEYFLDVFGKPLEFETVNDALQFLAERNFTITDAIGFDFNFEEEAKEDCMEEFSEALSKEKRRIQEALLSVGYYAYVVKFQAGCKDVLPRLEIEARPGDKEDREILG